jgi:hypothetical protein
MLNRGLMQSIEQGLEFPPEVRTDRHQRFELEALVDVFVTEGQLDSSLARSAWENEKDPFPEGRSTEG